EIRSGAHLLMEAASLLSGGEPAHHEERPNRALLVLRMCEPLLRILEFVRLLVSAPGHHERMIFGNRCHRRHFQISLDVSLSRNSTGTRAAWPPLPYVTVVTYENSFHVDSRYVPTLIPRENSTKSTPRRPALYLDMVGG